MAGDRRLRVENALREAGIHNTDYARRIMATIKPPQEPRKDQHSTLFKYEWNQFLSNKSNTKKRLTTFPNEEKGLENIAYSGVFLMNFEVFRNVYHFVSFHQSIFILDELTHMKILNVSWNVIFTLQQRIGLIYSHIQSYLNRKFCSQKVAGNRPDSLIDFPTINLTQRIGPHI